MDRNIYGSCMLRMAFAPSSSTMIKYWRVHSLALMWSTLLLERPPRSRYICVATTNTQILTRAVCSLQQHYGLFDIYRSNHSISALQEAMAISPHTANKTWSQPTYLLFPSIPSSLSTGARIKRAFSLAVHLINPSNSVWYSTANKPFLLFFTICLPFIHW